MLIKRRIILFMLLLAMVPMITVALLTEQVSEHAMKTLISRDFQLNARKNTEAIERFMAERIFETRLLAIRPEVIAAITAANSGYAGKDREVLFNKIQAIDREWIANKGKTHHAESIANNALSRLLASIQSANSEVYAEIFVTDRMGATLAMTETTSDFYQADEYWWQSANAMEDGAFLHDSGFDETADSIVIGVTVPVIDQGEHIGVFKINYRVKTMLDIIAAKGSEYGYEIALLRSDGSVIVSRGKRHTHSLSAKELNVITTSNPGVWEGSLHGEQQLLAHYPIKHIFSTLQISGAVKGAHGDTTENKRWYVLYEVAQSTLFAPLDKLREVTGLVTVIVLALTILIGSLLSRTFTKPLAALHQGTELITTGNLTHRIDLDTKDELGDLARAFNWMTQELQQVQSSRDELKREVEVRRRSEEALHQSEEKYRQLLNNIPQRIFHKDLEGRYIAVNPSFAKAFGIKPEDFIGKDDFDLQPREYAEKYRADDRAVILSGVVKEFDEAYEHEDELHYVHTLKAPIFDEQGHAKGILGIFSDVTEQHQAELEVKVAREYLQNVIDSMPFVLVGLDNKGKVTHWNLMAALQTGRSEEDALGKTLEEVRLLPEAIVTQVTAAIGEDKPAQLINQSLPLGEMIRRVNITIYPVPINEARGTVLLIEDNTERARVEAMMVQTEKMISVGGLAAGMAHELNNPLGGILQGLQNIRRRLSPALEKNIEVAKRNHIELADLQHYLEERKVFGLMQGITDAGSRASDIVANMMSFSRTLDETVAPVEIAGLLDSVIELASLDYDLKKKYGFREIKLVREYANDLPYVPCMEKDIKQVILNLLRNAAQALSGTSGQATPTITLRTRRDGNLALIQVEDNGTGMDQATQARIFDPFFTSRRIGEGTGLGLSVAYYIIVDTHRGNIQVESELGRGTRFTIKLPLGASAN